LGGGGLELRFGALSPLKPPSGDGTGFNIYFVFGYACFICICFMTANWLFSWPDRFVSCRNV